MPDTLSQKELDELREMYQRRPGVTESPTSSIIARLLATLAARERPSALDVETLANALALEGIAVENVASIGNAEQWLPDRKLAERILARLTEPDAGEKFSGWMDPADCADCTPDTTEATPLTGRFIDTHEGTVLVQDGNHIRGATSLELEFRAALQQPAVQPERRRGAGQRGFPLRDDEGAAPPVQPEGGPE